MTFTVSPSGVSTAFQYPVQVGQGQGAEASIDAVPGNTNAPIIFEPPPTLSGNALNLMIIATGQTDWGGCEIHVSIDDASYGMLGVIFMGEVQGLLTANFPLGSDPDTTNAMMVDVTMSQGQINPTTELYADKFLSLAWVDGEIISYTNVTLTSDFHYTFDTYIRRGVYTTPSAGHSSGAQFGIISAATFRHRFASNLIGTTLYFKFPSFNLLGLQLQNLSDVDAYTYTLTGEGLVPNVWYQSWSVGGKFTDFVLDSWDGNYEIFDVQAPKALTFAPNLAGSPTPGCEVPPAAAVHLQIQTVTVAGTVTTVGTLDYTPGSTSGAYNVPLTFSLAVGDHMRMYAAPTVDSTIAGCYGTIAASLMI
jgi:hypothetical protein